MVLKTLRLLCRQEKKDKWKWAKYEIPNKNGINIHHIYFHIPRPQGRHGDNVCAIILTSRDMGENKSCEPWEEPFIAEGELAGSDTRGICVIKPSWWSFNPPLRYEDPHIYIATITARQKNPRDGSAIIFYTEEKT